MSRFIQRASGAIGPIDEFTLLGIIPRSEIVFVMSAEAARVSVNRASRFINRSATQRAT
jgi:hypothetical protein